MAAPVDASTSKPVPWEARRTTHSLGSFIISGDPFPKDDFSNGRGDDADNRLTGGFSPK